MRGLERLIRITFPPEIAISGLLQEGANSANGGGGGAVQIFTRTSSFRVRITTVEWASAAEGRSIIFWATL